MAGYALYDYALMIACRERLEPFARAIERSLPPDAVVCDLGTGLGLFAIQAARLGARRVYAIEHHPVIRQAAELAREAGCADRIRFIRGFSTDVELPERVDLLVSDLRGSTPFHDQHLPSLIDARRRFLKPGGRMIPARDTLWLAIVGSESLYRRHVEPWAGLLDVDLSSVRDRLADRPARCHAELGDVLPGSRPWGAIDYHTVEDLDHRATVEWEVERAATGYGLCLWFDSELAQGADFSNAPGARPLPYGRLFLPWRTPLALERGQHVTVSLAARLAGGSYAWDWSVTVRRHEGGAVLAGLEQSAAALKPRPLGGAAAPDASRGSSR